MIFDFKRTANYKSLKNSKIYHEKEDLRIFFWVFYALREWQFIILYCRFTYKNICLSQPL